MILLASMELEWGGRRVLAALYDAGWASDDPDLTGALSNAFPLDAEEHSPADGSLGSAQIAGALEKWNGRILWQPAPDPIKRVY